MPEYFIITHFINQEPSKYGWREIPFITRKYDSDETDYFLGIAYGNPIPIEIINREVAENYYIPLINPPLANTTQSIWITPNGEIWLADSENPFEKERVLIDKVEIEKTALDLIYENSGFNVDSIDLENLPLELKRAWIRLINQIEEEPLSIKYFKSEQINLIKYDFLNEFNSIKDRLSEKLIEILQRNNKSDYSPKQEQIKTYDIDERSSLFFSKTVFLYPYYLDHLRKKYSGVIPYANQISLAVIIHRDNPCYKKWTKLRDDVKQEYQVKLENWELEILMDEAKSVNWLKDLMIYINSKEGKINFIKGYIFDAVTTEFQNKYFDSSTIINHMNQSSTDIDRLKELDYFRETEPRRDSFDKDKNSILILDPAEAFGNTANKRFIKEKIDDKTYEVINVKHGLNIPIGIGFSLYALPFLLMSNNWEVFQKLVVENVNTKGAKEKLRHLGIYMNSPNVMIEEFAH